MNGTAQTRTRIVQSRGNARVKELRAALRRGAGWPSGNSGADLIGLEGVHLVEEALRSSEAPQPAVQVLTVFVREGSEALLSQLPGRGLRAVDEVLVVSADALASALSTESAQPLAALASPPQWHPADLLRGPAPLIAVLDGVQDPGNVGTLLRSAEAFGASGVLALPSTASPWNAKTLRSSMGSALRLPLIGMAPAEALAFFAEHRLRTLAAVAHSSASHAPAELDLAQPLALLIGSEGAGLSAPLLGAAQQQVSLSYPGPVESLNAAVAGSILLYECSRQRAGLLATGLASEDSGQRP